MSRYLSHLAALALNRVEPLQPRLASRFEPPVNMGLAGSQHLDIVQEPGGVEMPDYLRHSTDTVTDSFDRRKPTPQGLGLGVETPVDAAGNNGSNAIQTSKDTVSVGRVQPSAGTVTDDRRGPVQQPQATRFKTSVEIAHSDNNQLKAKQDALSAVSPVQPVQSTKANNPVAKPVVTVSVDATANKNTGRQDQPKAREPSGWFQQPPYQAVTPKFYDDNDKTPERVNTRTERVQEHFIETTHSETVIREIEAPVTQQKNNTLEESSRNAPIKPASIVVRTEQISAESNTSRQASQQMPSATSSAESIPEPTIQVTIGRIEIRATQVVEKSAAKPRAASNTMSLDDYLKQRNGGRA